MGTDFISNPSDCFIGQRFSTKTHSLYFLHPNSGDTIY